MSLFYINNDIKLFPVIRVVYYFIRKLTFSHKNNHWIYVPNYYVEIYKYNSSMLGKIWYIFIIVFTHQRP